MHLVSKKGIDIYHEYYIDLKLSRFNTPNTAKIPVGTKNEILSWNKKIGDRIKKYDIIAYITGEIPIYSPFSGVFTETVVSPKIGDYSEIFYAVISCEEDSIPSYPVCKFEGKLTKENFITAIKNAAVFDEKRRDYLCNILKLDFNFSEILIDAFDDEPYNLSKTATILNFKNEVYEGARILAKAFDIKNISLLMGKNFQTNEFLKKDISEINKITISGKYPTKPVVLDYCEKSNAFQIDAGTCRAIYRAVFFGEPDIERVITVWGDGILDPSVVLIPFGVPSEYVLKEFCAFGMIERVVSGGVMTGHVASLNFPIYKWENALTASPLKKHHRTTECICCGRCAISCPSGLVPMFLLSTSKNKGISYAKNLCADLCTRCGACAYVCPSRIPLVDLIKKHKTKGGEA